MTTQVPFVSSRTSKLREWLVNWKKAHFLNVFPVGSSCCLQVLEDLCIKEWNQDPEILNLSESPELCDILIIGGNITDKYKPYLLETYKRLGPQAKVVLLGNCAIDGGPYQDRHILREIKSLIKVDLNIPGCPPSAELIYESLIGF